MQFAVRAVLLTMASICIPAQCMHTSLICQNCKISIVDVLDLQEFYCLSCVRCSLALVLIPWPMHFVVRAVLPAVNMASQQPIVSILQKIVCLYVLDL
jgi:hypothetical protein